MKTLYIVRHAKSSWANANQTDFERPLNDRGNKDAPNMAAHLIQKNIKLEHVISSPAVRAKSTCIAFAAAYNINEGNIEYKTELYHAPTNVFYEVLSNINNNIEQVAIFAHNPGITDFVNSLHTGCEVDDMPTTAIFAVSIQIENWRDFKTAKKEYLFFTYPKLL